ncbi:MAG: hypothetical protein WCO69_06805 [Candidatus Omnitrophota bacterium]
MVSFYATSLRNKLSVRLLGSAVKTAVFVIPEALLWTMYQLETVPASSHSGYTLVGVALALGVLIKIPFCTYL